MQFGPINSNLLFVIRGLINFYIKCMCILLQNGLVITNHDR